VDNSALPSGTCCRKSVSLLAWNQISQLMRLLIAQIPNFTFFDLPGIKCAQLGHVQEE
jgi:hypothetical protein